jgi:excisionase family DNA binding protein
VNLPALDALAVQVETMPTGEIPVFLGRLAQIEGYARARLKAPQPAKSQPKEAILTVDEVAEMLSVTPYYVGQLIKEGKLATVRLPGLNDEEKRPTKGKQRRVLASDLEAMLGRSRVPAAGERPVRRSA